MWRRRRKEEKKTAARGNQIPYLTFALKGIANVQHIYLLISSQPKFYTLNATNKDISELELSNAGVEGCIFFASVFNRLSLFSSFTQRCELIVV